MASDLQDLTESSVTALVTGVVRDAQDLVKQQLSLFQHEIREDLRKTKEAALSLALGLGTAGIGGLLLCWMLVEFLHWAAPQIPLWVCYGIIGAALSGLGALLLSTGIKTLKSLHPLPEQSVETLKENMRWIKNPK